MRPVAVARGAVARVRVAARGGLLLVVVRRVVLAGVAHEHGALLHGVALGAVGGAHVDAVLVVEAPADGVALDDEVAHGEGRTAATPLRRGAAGGRVPGTSSGGGVDIDGELCCWRRGETRGLEGAAARRKERRLSRGKRERDAGAEKEI